MITACRGDGDGAAGAAPCFVGEARGEARGEAAAAATIAPRCDGRLRGEGRERGPCGGVGTVAVMADSPIWSRLSGPRENAWSADDDQHIYWKLSKRQAYHSRCVLHESATLSRNRRRR
jgi:hypothetical protein